MAWIPSANRGAEKLRNSDCYKQEGRLWDLWVKVKGIEVRLGHATEKKERFSHCALFSESVLTLMKLFVSVFYKAKRVQGF